MELSEFENKLLAEWENKQNYFAGCSTISNYERYMLCYYLKEFLYFIELGYNFEKFYPQIIEALNLKDLKYPKYTKLTAQKYEQTIIFKEKLKSLLDNQLKVIKYNKNELVIRLDIIRKLYSLNEFEFEFLKYYVLKTTTPTIDKLCTFFDDTFVEFEIFGTQCLNLKSWVIPHIRKSLTNKGLITKKPGFNNDKICLNTKIIQVFSDPEVETKSQIKNILLGKTQKSELKWNDFEHLDKERNIVLNILTSSLKQKKKGINILFYGDVGTGKTQLAKLIANTAKTDMYDITSENSGKEAGRKDRLSDLASKQTMLAKSSSSCILFDEAEDVMDRGFNDATSASKAYLNTLMEETPVPIFWTINDIRYIDPAFLRRMTFAIEFTKLSDDIRLNIWKRTIKKNKLKVDNKKLIELNKTYDISPSLISNAVKTTKLINGSQDDFEVFVENVAKVVTKKKNIKKRKEFEMNKYNDKLVNTDLNISTLTSQIKACGKLNFSLCLYGEPGTGKSLYARYLAKELGVVVILKRASDLISSYVGETEQNIAEAFAEAKSKKAMLIFDEADSFLQARTNALKSWEVTKVNEMLTWMESHEYPFVCTTNLLDTLDEASLRRFTFKIKFDFMTREQVKEGMEHFFGIKNANVNIKGLTAGDFATVKKKADFLGITSLNELVEMLEAEVKIKKTKELKNEVGF